MNALSPTARPAPAAQAPNDYLPTRGDMPDTPEEAARAFEKVLVRRFVKTMTENMFKTTLSGENGPSWMKSQRGQQHDILTDVLADHIVDGGTLGIADMLLRDWGMAPEDDAAAPSEDAWPPAPNASPPPREVPAARPLRLALQMG